MVGNEREVSIVRCCLEVAGYIDSFSTPVDPSATAVSLEQATFDQHRESEVHSGPEDPTGRASFAPASRASAVADRKRLRSDRNISLRQAIT